MSYDINAIHISGTIQSCDRYDCKTGKSMAKLGVLCWKERMTILAFEDMAEQSFEIGARIEAKGRVQSTSYTGRDGLRHYGWQIVAKTLTLCPEPVSGDKREGSQSSFGGSVPAGQGRPSDYRPPVCDDPTLPF